MSRPPLTILWADNSDAAPTRLFHGTTETRTASQVHGNGRRPSRADLTPVDPFLLAQYNRSVAIAVHDNRRRPLREAARWLAQGRLVNTLPLRTCIAALCVVVIVVVSVAAVLRAGGVG